MAIIEISDQTENNKKCVGILKSCIESIYLLLRLNRVDLQGHLNTKREKYLEEWKNNIGKNVISEEYLRKHGDFDYSTGICEASPPFDLWCELEKITLTVSEQKMDSVHKNKLADILFAPGDFNRVTIDIYAKNYTTEEDLKDAIYHEILHAFGDRKSENQLPGKTGVADGIIRTNFIGVEGIKEFLSI